MDLVNEENIPRLQVRQECREIATAFDSRPLRSTTRNPHLSSNDLRQ